MGNYITTQCLSFHIWKKLKVQVLLLGNWWKCIFLLSELQGETWCVCCNKKKVYFSNILIFFNIFYFSNILIFFNVRILLKEWSIQKSGIFDIEMNRYKSIYISLHFCRNTFLQGIKLEGFVVIIVFCCCYFYLFVLLSSELSLKSKVTVGVLFNQVENLYLHCEMRGNNFTGILQMKWKIGSIAVTESHYIITKC